ncbi:AMP-binding protein [Nocardia sp. NPDC060220]|uniref:AMP-binding protein n=1 Tax=Nocardia sp. NPDC060220 TaxID=3347076 RepID=UPI003649EDA9
MISIDQEIADTLAEYGAADACAADLLCDRHPGDAIAFRIVEPDCRISELTYGQLSERSRRFATALARLGVRRGEAVGVLMSKSAELPVVLLAIWRLGAVHVPLFTAFAGSAVATRLGGADAKFVVADADQADKLAASTGLSVVQVGGRSPARTNWYAFEDLLAAIAIGEDDEPETVSVGADGTLVLLYTSGTTGAPKGVPVPVRALASMQRYLIDGLDVRASDVYWNAADPGWAYGLYLAVLAPLAMGRTSILLHAGFSAELTWRVLDQLEVTNFAAAPTIYRAMRAEPSTPVRLRCASSAGEPLPATVVDWSRQALGVEVRDHYGQTELSMVIANAWRAEIREPILAGSMGRALPGWSCAVLADDADVVAPIGAIGRLALDTTSPLMWFHGYKNAPDKTAERYSADGRWYFTGDTAKQDESGRVFFSARDDDVIIMAGYRIGPADVENALVTHEAVTEAAVVAAPDELRGEVLEAYVVLRAGGHGSPELVAELQQRVKQQFAAHAYPRRIHFVDDLPKTPSGKLQRYKLRADRR